MATLGHIYETSTHALRAEAMENPPKPQSSPQSPPHPSQPQGQPQSQKPKPMGMFGRAASDDAIVANSSNYSITPGPCWLEFTNPAAVSAGEVIGEVPIWGTGQMFAVVGKTLPVGCVIVRPTVPPPPVGSSETPETLAQKEKQLEQQRKQQAEKQQKELQQQKQPQPQQAQPRDTEGEGDILRNARNAGMPAETQARIYIDDYARADYQSEIWSQADTIMQGQPAGLTPEEQALTGMSPQGFPGFLPGLRAASVLPATMGVSRVTMDSSSTPAKIHILLVGSGSVPANSRWLIFTLQGV